MTTTQCCYLYARHRLPESLALIQWGEARRGQTCRERRREQALWRQHVLGCLVAARHVGLSQDILSISASASYMRHSPSALLKCCLLALRHAGLGLDAKGIDIAGAEMLQP